MVDRVLKSQSNLDDDQIRDGLMSIATVYGQGQDSQWRPVTIDPLYQALVSGWIIRTGTSDPADANRVDGKEGVYLRTDTGQIWYHGGDVSDDDPGWVELGPVDNTPEEVFGISNIQSYYGVRKTLGSNWEAFRLGATGGRAYYGSQIFAWGQHTHTVAQPNTGTIAFGVTFGSAPRVVLQPTHAASDRWLATVNQVGTTSATYKMDLMIDSTSSSSIGIAWHAIGAAP